MNSIFIISPLIGSVIGYFTNWLAIKMLFRPLREKRIFGIKVPFTPGVIPSRRDKLAASIGKAVGEVILTPEAFKKVVSDKRLKRELDKYLTAKLELLQDETRTAEEIIKEVFSSEDETTKIKAEFRNIFHDILEKFVKQGVIVELFEAEEIIDPKKLEQLFNSSDYQELKTKFLKQLEENIQPELLAEILDKLLTKGLAEYQKDNQELKDIFSKELQISAKEFILSFTPLIKKNLTAFLESQRAEEIIAEEIDSFMSRNSLLKMIENFISRDKIAGLIRSYLLQSFEQQKGEEILKEQLSNLYDKFLELSTADILAKINQAEIYELSQFIADQIVEKDLLLKLFKEFETKFKAKLLNDDQFQVKITSYLKELISENQLIFDTVYFLAFNTFNKLLAKPVKDYVALVKDEELEQLKNMILLIFEAVFEYYVYDIIKILDLEELVIKRINNFDVLEVEKLLLEVIETELNAITWFGAFLGLWMGLITPFLNMFL